MKTNFLIACTLLFLSSCGGLKDKIVDANPLNNGTMTAKIDGVSFKAETVQVTSKTTSNTLFSVAGVSITQKTGIGVNFDLTKGKIEAGKSYTCGNATMCEVTNDADSKGYYSTDEPQGGTSGTIKIDSYDSKTITGSFSGTLYDSNLKKKVVITEGKFEGKVGLL
jgi:Family of unknown function (DUF6252)